jgi:hypothetical protein
MFGENPKGTQVSRETLYEQVWSIPMARFSQEAKQINGSPGRNNMRIGLIHWLPDRFHIASTLNPLHPKLG